ncbi:MAG: arsenical pump-driving ATPase [Syntrophales bacterium]|nr:arsenical pump-driving ATPase [Syntrophales bacterium]MDD5533197.1 arsenical pump-driving ATPase [Syntrophales bacterium]
MIRDFIEPKTKEVKFIFFSGKGGVGKSTMSCAAAVWLAGRGYKTLLVTTDPAPNLSDIFGQEIGHHITSIKDLANLHAIEIDPDTASEEYRERIVGPLRDLLNEKNLQVIKEQLNSPCVEEVAAFDKFIEFMDDPQYDAVIFDTAPTGHTIRLLELPGGWTETLANSSATCIGPGASLQTAKAKYEKAISYLQDRNRTSFVFVLKPENLSVMETKRSSAELSKLGIETNLLIVNGILPGEACTDEFFRNRKRAEEKIVERIAREFPTLPKIYYPLQDREVSGIDLLISVGRFICDGKGKSVKISPSAETAWNFERIRRKDDFCGTLFAPANGSRYLFFTGKGGVGKSTIASTTSVCMAQRGFKTLIITTDPASHLHEIFGQPIGHEPTRIKGIDNLYAARIDQRKALEEYKLRILEAVKDQSEETKKSVEEDLNSPCAEEMAAFERFMSYFKTNGFNITVFDTAPTGHTLRLLELPTDWKGFIDLGTLTKQTSEETTNKYADIIEKMKNPAKSSFVFVMYPEYTPMIEAWRAAEELKKQVGIETAAVAVNYILPDHSGENPFFHNRRKQQEKYVLEIEGRFNKPMMLVPLLDREPKGLEDLKSLGREICGGI